MSAVINAHEARDVVTGDAPSVFVQTWSEIKEGDKRVVMKITGVPVDPLVNNNPDPCEGFAVCKNGEKAVCAEVLKAVRGMLVSALLWCKQFGSDLEAEGFAFNPCNPCAANNKMVNGHQQTVGFHVDDVMSSHVDPEVNKSFAKW